MFASIVASGAQAALPPSAGMAADQALTAAGMLSSPPRQGIGNVVAETIADGARVTIMLERPAVSAIAFSLDGPRRIVVDLSGLRAAVASFPAEGRISAVRLGQFDPATSRLVLDLEEPMTLAGVASDDPARLVLTLKPSTAAEFQRSVASGRRTVYASRNVADALAAAAPGSLAKDPLVFETEVTGKPGGSAGKVRPIASYRIDRPVIVIDPGHGGKDVGAISVHDHRYEKDLTLAVAKAIKRELDASGVVTTLLTRSDDRFLPLHQRVDVARAARADLFISIHADSAPNTGASGATIYTLSEVASDREAARLAASENKADIIAGVDLGREASDVSDILIHLAQRNTKNASADFADTMQREMQSTVRFRTNYHRFAGFRVLKAADMPAVLLETGYLTNMDDARWLYSAAGQKVIAKGVRRAVEGHFRRRIAHR